MIGCMTPGIRTGAPVADIDEADLTITHPKHHAAGIPAVAVALGRGLAQAGVVRTAQALSRLNHRGGFDCPGCAWPEPAGRRRPAEFCENGAKAVAEESTLRTVGPISGRHIRCRNCCSAAEYWLGMQGRLTDPMVIREGSAHYEPITWADAFTLIGDHLRACEPNRAAFYTSGRTSNEAAYLYQLMARSSAPTICRTAPTCVTSHRAPPSPGPSESARGRSHWPTSSMPTSSWSSRQNPGTNHPRMLTALPRPRPTAHVGGGQSTAGGRAVQIPRSADVHRTGSRAAPNWPTDFLQINWAATWRCSRPLVHLLLAADEGRPRHAARRRLRRRQHPGFEELRGAPGVASTGPTILTATGLAPRADREVRPTDLALVQGHRHLLGSGPDPAPRFGGDDVRSS